LFAVRFFTPLSHPASSPRSLPFPIPFPPPISHPLHFFPTRPMFSRLFVLNSLKHLPPADVHLLFRPFRLWIHLACLFFLLIFRSFFFRFFFGFLCPPSPFCLFPPPPFFAPPLIPVYPPALPPFASFSVKLSHARGPIAPQNPASFMLTRTCTYHPPPPPCFLPVQSSAFFSPVKLVFPSPSLIFWCPKQIS